MKILNFGSINIDHVYSVNHFVRPGETLSSSHYHQFAGGKGFNQSVALAYAGATVYHAGKVGKDGIWLMDHLRQCRVDVSFIKVADSPTGHAIIQVNPQGENSIILHGGANQYVTESDAENVLSNFSRGDHLLLQNEISTIPEIMKLAARQGLIIAFNPAPMNPEVLSFPLDLVDIFILNEIEGMELTGESELDKICGSMREKYSAAVTVLTAGEKGVLYADSERTLRVAAKRVKPVDTTGAGDTFIGYLLAEIVGHRDVEEALRFACKAAAVCVTRPGAAESIPKREELE
jgi:ribokinase